MRVKDVVLYGQDKIPNEYNLYFQSVIRDVDQEDFIDPLVSRLT